MMRHPRVLLSLLPLLIPFAAIFLGGIIITVLQSLGILMFSYHYDDIFFGYRELLTDRWFVESALFSLYVAATATTIAIIFGTLFAYLIWRLPHRYHGRTVIYKVPLILPHIAVGFMAVILLAKTGVLAALSYQLGLIDSFTQFPDLLYRASGIDIIGAYVYKETPFVMVLVYAMLSRFESRLMDCAKMLGASPTRIFFTLILPFLMPAINTSFIILFIFSFGGFDLPFVLGDSYPGMISIRIYDYFFHKDLALRPVAMAMLTLIFLMSLGFIIAYLKIAGKMMPAARKL